MIDGEIQDDYIDEHEDDYNCMQSVTIPLEHVNMLQFH